MEKELKKDEWGIVLDFLSHGHYSMDRSQPIAQVLGDEYFSLLEVIVREESQLKVGDRIYIGDGKREEVRYIRGRIEPNKLTGSAKAELPLIVEELVKKKAERFVGFFNKSGPVATRLHSLELLPGIGKKHLFALLEARKEKPFESFDDIKDRVPLLPDPEKMVVKRVLEEMEDLDKHRLFVPRMERTQQRRF